MPGQRAAHKFQMNVTIDKKLAERLTKEAKRRGLSRSQLVQMLCQESLETHEGFTQFTSDPIVRRAMVELFTKPELLRKMAGLMGNQDPVMMQQVTLDFLGLSGDEERKK